MIMEEIKVVTRKDEKTDERHVLLVEDNPDEVLLTRRAFEMNKIVVPLVIVNDGQEALDYIYNTVRPDSPSRKPSLILLDLNLRKLNGLDVLKQIKDDTRVNDIPVVVLTSSMDERDIEKSYTLGARDYVRKPISFSDFVRLVHSIIARWL
jgi:two-component system, response regulator